jgi:hypothetical protein
MKRALASIIFTLLACAFSGRPPRALLRGQESLPVAINTQSAATPPHLSSTTLSFVSENLGTTSFPLTVILTNPGDTTLSISSITIAGTNKQDFTQQNSCGAPVLAKAQCAISVTFAPTAAGNRTASVTITDNASNSPQTVSLAGTGTAAAAPAVSLSYLLNKAGAIA